MKGNPDQASIPTRVRKSGQSLGSEDEPLTNIELVSLVCEVFCRGKLPSEIQEILLAESGIDLYREQVYRYIAYAAERGWMQYHPPPEHALKQRLHDRYEWLRGVHVTHTAASSDVSFRTANVLLELIRTHAMPPYDKREVHVGFAGGHSMRDVAHKLATLLHGPAANMPETIVFHALVSGFDVNELTTDPRSFFTYLYDDAAMPTTTQFVALHAPPIVKTTSIPELMSLDAIRQAFEKREQLDIIVTSGGCWEPPCEHSMLRDYMKHSPESLAALVKAGCTGDMLWRPLNADGPIERQTKIRAMTLVELSDLDPFIKRGGAVLFMLGPCRRCRHARGRLLRMILDLDQHLVTHLVTDSRTAVQSLM